MNFFNLKKDSIRLLFLCSFAFLLFSCGKKDATYTVDPQLKPYLDRFLQEGAKRGKTFNVEEDGLIMRFADLTDDAVGICYYRNPICIEIDRTYWNKTTANSENKENLREDVVFHELGHGLLNRRHLNDTLPDNEWTSMMCGGDVVNGRSWAVNFNGYRKSYYLDELFNFPKTTPAPDWSKLQHFNGEHPTYLFASEDYTFSGQSSGKVGSGNSLTYQTGDGFYTISSSDVQSTLLSFYSPKITGDFYWETNCSISFGTQEGFSGIFSGYWTDDKGNNSSYFTISGPRSYACNTGCTIPFAEVLISDKFKKGKENKLALLKKSGELFFYINDELVYRNDYNTSVYNAFGLIVPAKGSVAIRNYALYSSEQSALRSVQPETQVRTQSVSLPKVIYSK